MENKKHDWSVVRMGGTTCRDCNKLRMPHNFDSDCNPGPYICKHCGTDVIYERELEKHEANCYMKAR